MCRVRAGRKVEAILQHSFSPYLLVAVHRDAKQPGEIHQAAVAHYVGDVSAAKRGRDAEEEQDEDGVPDDAADL